jgi:endonuclease YncB( thermonuclease family)
VSMHRKQMGIAAVFAVIAIVSSSSACGNDDLTGSARVIDGDTIAVGFQHVRLQGIDAPETDQVCLDAQGERWTCGLAARERLSAHIAGRAVRCASRGEDRYGRMLATCSAGVNRQGERIYHLPGQGTYATINMRDPQKRWFCSEDDARAAGWRPAKR